MNKQDEEILYNDLQYTTNAYFVGEQVYPYWEAIYAILTGAFLTAYWVAVPIGKLMLCVVGLIYSINWRRLVERNRCFANAREGRMKILCKVLQRRIDLDSPVDVSPHDGMESELISEITTFRLFEDQKNYLVSHTTWWNRTSTWALRIFVPNFMIYIWILLVLYALYTLFITLHPLPQNNWLQKLLYSSK